MKAAQYNKYGGPEVIEINNDAPKPSLSTGQILVEVSAASLNPFDFKLRSGYLKDHVELKFPVTIGGNFSGVVTEIAEDVSDFKVSDEVYGQALVLNGGSGSIAEFATSNVANSALKPQTIDHLEAASLPLVGTSAIQALEQHINLQPGQKILIHGGAGGIGTIAIQIAKSIGAYVVTTASSENIEFVKQLGADEVIDYKQEAFEDQLTDLDAVFDTVGGETTDKSFKVLKSGGVLVSMVQQPNTDLAEQKGITAIYQNTDTNTKNLNRLTELVNQGIIKAQIDKVFSLDQARESFEYLETGHPRGKVVIDIIKS